MLTDGLQVRRSRAYLDSLSMDGAEVAVNCLCSVRSCATCWCPDSELADAHREACKYSRMAEVMAELVAERDVLLVRAGRQWTLMTSRLDLSRM
jgi:hypothetical protein